MTFSDPLSDSLQIRMHSYLCIVSPCFSCHFSCFFTLSFTIKIIFYFLPLKKPWSLPPISTLKDHTVISVWCVMPWFYPFYSSPEISEPFCSPFLFNSTYSKYYYIDPHLLEAQNQSPLLPSSLATCPYHNSQTPLLNYFLSLASVTSAALSFHVSIANHSVSLYFQGPCVFICDCMEFWFLLLPHLCICLCLSSLTH